MVSGRAADGVQGLGRTDDDDDDYYHYYHPHHHYYNNNTTALSPPTKFISFLITHLL